MPYITIEELRARRTALLRGHEQNTAQLSIRVPESLVRLAKEAAGDHYQDELRLWMWAGAVATAAERSEGLRARFSLSLLEDGATRVSLLRYDQGRMVGRVARRPRGGQAVAWFDARFHPALAAEQDFGHRLSEMAVALKNHALKEFASGDALAYERAWIVWKPGPAHLEAGAASIEAMDRVLSVVATQADTLLDRLRKEGRRFSERPDWILMRDDSMLSTDPRIRESIERADREPAAERRPVRRRAARG